MGYSQIVKNAVRSARINQNLTLDALSLKFGVSKSTIQLWVKDLPALPRTKAGNSWRNNPWVVINDYYQKNDVVFKDLLEIFPTLTQSAIHKAIKEGFLEKKAHAETMRILHRTNRHPGWLINGRAQRSYPEEFFYRGLVNSGISDKYTICEKYSFGPYWFDFAILDSKIDIEIDGQQHFATAEAIMHDEKRDLWVKSSGWRVYRISWKELSANPAQVWADLLEFIDNSAKSRRYPVEEGTKPKKYKSRADYFSSVRSNYQEKAKVEIIKIQASNIDFTKYGWVKKVVKLIGKKHQKVGKWMRLYLPKIYNGAYKRIKKGDW